MKGLIVGNGEIENSDWLKETIKTIDYIICADGGANHLANIGLKPNLVIGDLDSVKRETLKFLENEKVVIKKYPEEKDYTDTELAIKYLINKGVKEITFVGVIGSRLDHTLANIFLLKNLLDRGIKGKILNDKNTVYVVDEKIILERKENSFISIIPINTEGAVLTLKGFKYDTDREKFPFSSSYGISNEIIEDQGIIEVHKGICLVIISKD